VAARLVGAAAEERHAAAARQRVMFEGSWYGTPMALRSSGVRPVGVKWTMNSWQSLRYRARGSVS